LIKPSGVLQNSFLGTRAFRKAFIALYWNISSPNLVAIAIRAQNVLAANVAA
jgi:hypothetical protein